MLKLTPNCNHGWVCIAWGKHHFPLQLLKVTILLPYNYNSSLLSISILIFSVVDTW
jgi:hypothetical protein